MNQPLLNNLFLTAVLGTPQSGLPDATETYSGITTDSRKVLPGSIFLAIQGEKMDGHDFIPLAIQLGAKAIITSHSLELTDPSVSIYQVSNTTEAFRKIAFAWRRFFKIPVIAVAGSVGKTTTKEFIAALLSSAHGTEAVLKTLGSQNGVLGIPMTLVELRLQHRFAVIEVGIDEPGTMLGHIQGVRPTHTIVTRIGPEHMEKLIDLGTIAHEEGLAFSETIKQGGSIALNLDDPWLSDWEESVSSAQKWTFSFQKNRAEFFLKGNVSFQNLEIQEASGARQILENPLPGLHNFENLLGAATIARMLGLSFEEIQKGLLNFKSAPGRSKVETHSATQALFFIDTYNANPSSMNAALSTVSELAKNNQKSQIVLCLGDMLELGENEFKFHEDLAEPIVKSGANNVIVYGPRMKKLAAVLHKRTPEITVHITESHEEAARLIRPLLNSKTLVLFKGSRGMRIETVLDFLN